MFLAPRKVSKNKTSPTVFRPRLLGLEDRCVPHAGIHVVADDLTDPNVFFNTTGLSASGGLQAEDVFFASVGAAQQQAQDQIDRAIQTYQVGYQQNTDQAVTAITENVEQQNGVIESAGQQIVANNQQLSAESQAQIDALTRIMEQQGKSKEEINRKVQEVLQNAANAVNSLPPGTTPDSPQVQEIKKQADTIIATTLAQEQARTAEFDRQVESVKREYFALQGKFSARQDQIIQAAIASYNELKAAQERIIDAWAQQNAALYNAALAEYNRITAELSEKIRAAEQALNQAKQAEAEAQAQEAERIRQMFQQFNQNQQQQPEQQQQQPNGRPNPLPSPNATVCVGYIDLGNGQQACDERTYLELHPEWYS